MRFFTIFGAAALAATAMSGNVYAQADDGDVLDQAIQMGCEARQAISDRVNQFWEDAEEVVCNTLDMENRYEESEYLWVSEDAGCDMSYTMPGLPTLSGVGGSSCEQLQAITGRQLDQANEMLQGAVDDALESVGRDRGEVDVDLDRLARDVISNQ